MRAAVRSPSFVRDNTQDGIGQRFQSFVGEREHRTDVDFAEDERVVAGAVGRTVEEVGVPERRQRVRVDTKQLLHLRYPFSLEYLLQRLKLGLGRSVVQA